MLIVDLANKDTSKKQYYFLVNDSEKLQLCPGDQLKDEAVLGRILFLCRPPDKNSEF